LNSFILAGHSFGGFICGHYALKYSSHLKKLILLSPIGVEKDLGEEIDYERLMRAVGKNPSKL